MRYNYYSKKQSYTYLATATGTVYFLGAGLAFFGTLAFGDFGAAVSFLWASPTSRADNSGGQLSPYLSTTAAWRTTSFFSSFCRHFSTIAPLFSRPAKVASKAEKKHTRSTERDKHTRYTERDRRVTLGRFVGSFQCTLHNRS